jgi:hypothetical protein
MLAKSGIWREFPRTAKRATNFHHVANVQIKKGEACEKPRLSCHQTDLQVLPVILNADVEFP